MGLNTLQYYFREALFSLVRNRWLSLASIGTVTISLLILGSSLLLILNANHVAGSVESTVEISVFLKQDAAGAGVSAIEQKIKAVPGVEEVEFISRNQALQSMKKSFGDKKNALEGLDTKNNPLPDGFRVKTANANLVKSAAQSIEKISGVEQVRYGQGVVEKLLAVTGWVRFTGLIAMFLLACASVFLIATTTRLSVYARRHEISIMKILGATNWFVQLPFILEGVILGAFGALLALTILHISYYQLVGRMEITLPFIQLVTDKNQILPYMGSLLVLGVAIGALGSIISTRRFLKV